MLIFWQFFSLFGLDLLVYTSAIIFGGLTPDVLEPAKHYTHRKTCHSKKALKYSSYVALGSFLVGFLINFLWYVCFFAVGYSVHLLLDSTTKMGLPDK
jgi:hypothetical protein